jgi:hypothetical protein
MHPRGRHASGISGAMLFRGAVTKPAHPGAEDFSVFEKMKRPPLREYKPRLANWEPAIESAHWLKAAPWQVFCTYTFGWRVSDEEAEHAFQAYIDRIEGTIKADVSYVCGHEKRFSGCGKPACGRHFHAVLASAAPLSPPLLKVLWTGMAGNRDDGADVRTYDPDRKGLLYVLKNMNQQHGDWSFRKLHLVLPNVAASALNHRSRRNLQRHQARLKAFAGTKPPILMPGGFVPAVPLGMFGHQF